jgi:hypothetical protein
MNTLDTEEKSIFDEVVPEVIETDNPFGDDFENTAGEPVTPEDDLQEEVITDTPFEEEPKKPKQGRPSKQSEELQYKIDSGKKILQYLAERKGIAGEIDFDAVSTEDDIADLVEILEEYDQHHAMNSIKSKDKNLSKVIEYLEAKGDPSKIADILVEQKEFIETDITTEQGAKSLLKQYYKNVLGLSDEVINKRITKYTENGLLQEEAEDIKPLYDSDIEKRQQKLIEDATKQRQKEQLVVNQRKKQFIDLLQDNKVAKPIAQKYYQTAFGKRVLEDGTELSEMDYLYKVRQSDPSQYLKLVEFMSDPEQYDKKILQTKSNKQVIEQHNKRINFTNNKSPDLQESRTENNKPKFKF